VGRGRRPPQEEEGRELVKLSLLALFAACGSSTPKPFIDIDRSLDSWDGLAPLPLTGDIDFKATLTSPKNELKTATGTVMVMCGHCALGDGATKLAPKGGRSVWGGEIDFGKLDLGKIDGTATFKDGKGDVDLRVVSSSVEVTLKGTVVLANDFMKSKVDLQLAYRASDELRTADPKMYTLVTMLGAQPDPQGWSKIHLSGPLDATRREDASSRPTSHLSP
jgi:type II secretion system protein N